MPEPVTRYHRILAYLKGQLSGRQRHDLEKEMMRDAFDEEAFEGLMDVKGPELESDLETLMRRVDARTGTSRKRSLVPWFRIAAGLVLVAGLGTVLYLVLHKPVPQTLTVKSEKQTPPETQIPEAPVMAAPEAPVAAQESQTAPQEARKVFEQEVTPVPAEKSMAEPEIMEEQEPERAVAYPAEPAAAEPKKEAAVMAARSKGRTYNGRVVDSQGEPLPGVNIVIKGTSKGTVTDTEGNFSLPLADSSATLEASYIGFKPVEVKAAREKTIVMHEDMMALNEVVVVGYGTQKKSEITGAVSTVQLNKDANTDMAIVTKPVPPGGSLKEFRKWVNERLNREIIQKEKGKQRTIVTLTIKTDGSVSDVKVSAISEAVAAEYKRVILLSPPWQPATRDEVKVENTVEIKFVDTVE